MDNQYRPRIIMGRENRLKNNFFQLVYNGSSYPRLLLEVFMRKNFGPGYFNFGSVMSATIILLILSEWPRAIELIKKLFDRYYIPPPDLPATASDIAWYGFIGLFIIISLYHKITWYLTPRSVRLERHSLYPGDSNRLFEKLKKSLNLKSDWFIETVFEPGIFILLGFILCKLNITSVGILFIVCGLIYSFSYVSAYMQGDAYIRKWKDTQIGATQFSEAMTEKKPTDKTYYQERQDPGGSAQMPYRQANEDEEPIMVE